MNYTFTVANQVCCSKRIVPPFRFNSYVERDQCDRSDPSRNRYEWVPEATSQSWIFSPVYFNFTAEVALRGCDFLFVLYQKCELYYADATTADIDYSSTTVTPTAAVTSAWLLCFYVHAKMWNHRINFFHITRVKVINDTYQIILSPMCKCIKQTQRQRRRIIHPQLPHQQQRSQVCFYVEHTYICNS